MGGEAVRDGDRDRQNPYGNADAPSRLFQEWNNKDPFYDRDLNNFRLLFDLRAIEVGIIITRCSHLQEIFNALGRGPSYGNSTTHMDKLLTRIDGGAGGGCPVLVFGISKELYIEDEAGQIEVTASEGSDD